MDMMCVCVCVCVCVRSIEDAVEGESGGGVPGHQAAEQAAQPMGTLRHPGSPQI